MRSWPRPGNPGWITRIRPVNWSLAVTIALLGYAFPPRRAAGQVGHPPDAPRQVFESLAPDRLTEPWPFDRWDLCRPGGVPFPTISAPLDPPHRDRTETPVMQNPDFDAPRRPPGERLRDAGGWVGCRPDGVLNAFEGRPASVPTASCESWLHRPFSAGWFMGLLQGGSLIDDWVGANQGYFAGYRLGWDHDHYWGCEMRFSFAKAAIYDRQRAKEAQRAADDALGLAPDDPFRRRFDRRRDCTVGLWDISLLYYPWGDTVWRPYLMAGLGTATIEFTDRLSTRYEQTVFGLPLAIGVKYRCYDWLALRLECADNIAFGDRFNTLHNLGLTGGVEVRFGGTRTAYWPWNPGRHYWQ